MSPSFGPQLDRIAGQIELLTSPPIKEKVTLIDAGGINESLNHTVYITPAVESLYITTQDTFPYDKVPIQNQWWILVGKAELN